jgi:GAF domain-containing protein
MTTVSAHRLAEVFVECADTLVDEFDLIDFLQMLTMRTAEILSSPSVGLLLTDQRGNLQFMAASQEDVRILELFQVQTREGPCMDAFRTGEPVVNADLAGAFERWPRFAPRATEAGFHTVHAFPLRLRHQVIGALNVFGQTVNAEFDATDVQIIQALTDVAAIGILQERAIHRGELLTEQLQAALTSRVVIEQAKGAVAHARGVSVDQAFDMIRVYARSNNRKLSEVAFAIVTDVSSLPGFSAS